MIRMRFAINKDLRGLFAFREFDKIGHLRNMFKTIINIILYLKSYGTLFFCTHPTYNVIFCALKMSIIMTNNFVITVELHDNFNVIGFPSYFYID